MMAVLRVVLVTLALVLSSSGTARAETTITFYYTGGEQTLAIPAGVSTITVVAAGGRGGSANGHAVLGGYGATVSGTINVTPGSALYVEVGENGNSGVYRGSGGEASDVRTCSSATNVCTGGGTSLGSRLLVAAGGGGAGWRSVPPGGAPPATGSAGGNAGQPGESGSSASSRVTGGEGGQAGTDLRGGAGGAGGLGEQESFSGGDGALGKGGFGGENTRFGEGGAQAGGGGGGGLYGGGGGGEGGSGWGERAESGGGGGGSSLMPPGGTLGIDTTGVPVIQITVPTPVKEESKMEEPIKEESPAKTSTTSPTTLTQPIVASLIPTTVLGPSLTPAPIKHELSKAQLLAKELAKCKKIKRKRKRAKCVAAAKERQSAKKK